MKHRPGDYVIRMLGAPVDVGADKWNELLALQPESSPFMRYEYLAALHDSGSATSANGWTLRLVVLEREKAAVAACALYLKSHSYGEYVFDWTWASAYQRQGLTYYPKALVAVPFTPVPGTRLMARSAADREQLATTLITWCKSEALSSLHVLFAGPDDLQACLRAGMMLRHTIQFHWNNTEPAYPDFDSFLATLSQAKRKKISQERRKVENAGVSFRCAQGQSIAERDWDFFYRCYERTYLEHGNMPYLNRDFFRRLAADMPENWLLFVAQRHGREIAASLIAISQFSPRADAQQCGRSNEGVAYGRYWGALERVDCLHFEACYYQPIAWCIAHGFRRFEGGAQGEHKMARALMPVKTGSAHWLAQPAFADAVERFLEREDHDLNEYVEDLKQRSPFRRPQTDDPT